MNNKMIALQELDVLLEELEARVKSKIKYGKNTLTPSVLTFIKSSVEEMHWIYIDEPQEIANKIANDIAEAKRIQESKAKWISDGNDIADYDDNNFEDYDDLPF